MKLSNERIVELCDVRRNGPVVVEMAEEIRELRKDRARLEHTMQSMHITAQGCRCGQTIRIYDTRDAIDAAMESGERG